MQAFDSQGLFFLSSVDELSRFGQSSLSGTAIAENAIIFDHIGWCEYLCAGGSPDIFDLKDGRFLAFQPRDGKLLLRTDPAGAEMILLYQDGTGRWACSNSFYYLAEKVRELGWPLDLNEAACASMFIEASFGRQPISKQTAFQQISIIPINDFLEINCDTKILRIRSEVDTLSSSRGMSYEDNILSWFLKWKGIVRSLVASQQFYRKVLVDLSGGVDSRTVMSLFLGSEATQVTMRSQPHKSPDLKVARSLGREFGFSVTTQKPSLQTANPEEQYHLYTLGNAGIFNIPTHPPLHTTSSDVLKFGGVFGENLRPFYQGSLKDWRSKIIGLLPSSLAGLTPKVIELLTGASEDYGIDEDDPVGMVTHYRELRSRIIGGRSWYENLKYRLVTPFGDPSLYGAYDKLDSNLVMNNKILMDILLLGGGRKLAEHPFDVKSKMFDKDLLRSSPFWNNGQPYAIGGSRVEEFAVYGKLPVPQSKVIGESKSLFVILQDVVQRDRENPETIACLPPPLRPPLERASLSLKGEGRRKKIEIITWHSILKMAQLTNREAH